MTGDSTLYTRKRFCINGRNNQHFIQFIVMSNCTVLRCAATLKKGYPYWDRLGPNKRFWAQNRPKLSKYVQSTNYIKYCPVTLVIFGSFGPRSAMRNNYLSTMTFEHIRDKLFRTLGYSDPPTVIWEWLDETDWYIFLKEVFTRKLHRPIIQFLKVKTDQFIRVGVMWPSGFLKCWFY